MTDSTLSRQKLQLLHVSKDNLIILVWICQRYCPHRHDNVTKVLSVSKDFKFFVQHKKTVLEVLLKQTMVLVHVETKS